VTKFFVATCGTEKIKTCWKAGEHRVSLETCRPNDWNMNEVAPQMFEKLKLVIKETHDQAGRIPPIAVRPHPKKKRLLQIIDGEHRWKILPLLGITEIDVVVLYVDTERAMLMTAELNYNRGEPSMEKYPTYLARVMKEADVDAKYLAERLPDSEDEIRSYLEAADLDVDEIHIPDDDDEDDEKTSGKDASESDALVEIKFVVRQGAAEVIEREVSRLKKHLGGGKNERDRAFEMMAVLSSQTPDGSIASSMEEDEDEIDVSVDKPRKKKKKKLKKPD